METTSIQARDGLRLDIRIYEAAQARAAVQIIHGMEEHQGRYEPFALFLRDHGFTVVSSDLRGHGKGAEQLGFFKASEGYVELIEDQKAVTNFIQTRFPGLPVYLFAHSMGSIIARVLLQEASRDYGKVVLTGYPNYRRGTGFGILLAELAKRLRGPHSKSALINAISVGAFNRSIQHPKTDHDWICRNEETVRGFLEDPYCGFGFTCSAFSDLFHLVRLMHDPSRYRDVDPDLPFLLLRGQDDPCPGGDRGAADSLRVLVRAGFRRIRCGVYPHMRHEILAETERQQVYEDILLFYQAPRP